MSPVAPNECCHAQFFADSCKFWQTVSVVVRACSTLHLISSAYCHQQDNSFSTFQLHDQSCYSSRMCACIAYDAACGYELAYWRSWSILSSGHTTFKACMRNPSGALVRSNVEKLQIIWICAIGLLYVYWIRVPPLNRVTGVANVSER